MESRTDRVLGAVNRAGTSSTNLIRRAGSSAESLIDKHIEKRVESAHRQKGRQGRVGPQGAAALEKCAGAAGFASRVAHRATDAAANTVSKVIHRNKITRSMREAPVGTTSRTAHDVTKAVAMNAATFIAAAGEEGKNLLQKSTDGAAQVAGAKYGENAERATRAAGNFTVDAYQVIRTPQKFATNAVVKGAAKAGGEEVYQGQQRRVDSEDRHHVNNGNHRPYGTPGAYGSYSDYMSHVQGESQSSASKPQSYAEYLQVHPGNPGAHKHSPKMPHKRRQ